MLVPVAFDIKPYVVVCVSAHVCQFSCAWKVNTLGQGLLVGFSFLFLFYTVFEDPAPLGTKVEIITLELEEVTAITELL